MMTAVLESVLQGGSKDPPYLRSNPNDSSIGNGAYSWYTAICLPVQREKKIGNIRNFVKSLDRVMGYGDRVTHIV